MWRWLPVFLTSIYSLLPSTAAAQQPPGTAQQTPPTPPKFNPPRIRAVIRGPDTGHDDSAERVYWIDRGQESNINAGDVLNVYREVRLGSGNAPPMRIMIGTMTITQSQNGSSMGVFHANDNIQQAVVRFKSPVKGDIVVPRLIIDSSVLFDPGKAQLKPGAAQEFVKVANFVRNFSPSKIIIAGHTDSDGSEEFNQALSERRAQVVRQYLITTYSFITPAMVEARGYGERQPIVPNDTPENKALNRRIEVIIWD